MHHLQASHDGCPITVSSNRIQLHSSQDPEVLQAIFVYVYSESDTVDVVFEVLHSGSWTTLARQRVPVPLFGPLCIFNGTVLRCGSTLHAHTEGGKACVVGYSKTSPVSTARPAAGAILNQLVLGHQVLSSVDARVLQLDAQLPLSLLHLKYPGRIQLSLPAAAVGTIKHILVASKDAVDASAELRLGGVVVTLNSIGTCVSTVSLGTSWLLLKS